MTGEGKRPPAPLAALIAAVLVAALLAACGGSDSDSNSSTEATTANGSTKTGAPASDADGAGGGSQSQGDQGDSQGQSDDQAQVNPEDDQSQDQQSGGSSGSQSTKAPLAVSGGGSEQFRTKGGDNSIQEFGEESDESELQEAAEAVHDFYVARVEGEWNRACSYLSKSNIEQLEKLGSQSAQAKGADCATMLEAFTRPLPAELERAVTTVDAGSLRREGDQGFLIYYGTGRETYAMPLKEEGGSWKLTALSGTTLS